jgi:Phage integrase family
MTAGLPAHESANITYLPTTEDAGLPINHAGWIDWLNEHIDRDWRPGEWNNDIWLFTGDPDNSGTILARCRTQACNSMLTADGLCASCRRELGNSGLSVEEFVATYVPVRVKRSPTVPQPRCLVSRNGTHCNGLAISRGLCDPHYNQWLAAGHRRHGLVFDHWLATVPVPRIQPAQHCVVAGCDMEGYRRGSLCYHHYYKHRREAPTTPVGEWAFTETPFLQAQHFSLASLQPTTRLELLYALHQRDVLGYKIDPAMVRRLVKHVVQVPSLIGAAPGRSSWSASLTSSKRLGNLLVGVLRMVEAGHKQMLGVEPMDQGMWNPSLVDSDAEFSPGPPRFTKCVDFTGISQGWLRNVLMEWARRSSPRPKELREAIKAAAIASTAVERRGSGGGHDPKTLGFNDVDAIVRAIREARDPDSGLYSYSYRRALNARFFSLLEFGRHAGLMDDVPGSFSRHRSHFIPGSDCGDDELGRAIPEPVIAQLDTCLPTLGDGFSYRGWTHAQIKHMLRTAYIVLRDTGRRPLEVCALRVDCLRDDGGDVLIWDNFKRKRLRRQLPIASTTAQAIRDWRRVRAQMQLRPDSAGYLFPARGPAGGRESRTPHLTTAELGRALRDWVKSIPEIHSDVPGADGQPLPFDRSLIYPYAFRHSYAQRHADAGVEIDVLKELMDHRSVDTTMGYYKVTSKRKREAVETMRHMVVDRAGNPDPAPTATVYELHSVAVPFGNCIEPSNVKAGGQACPIRFQCSGCGFYRPDPSYLIAIDQHINGLKAERETARAIGADDFVIRNLTDQIESFDRVRTTMRELLNRLDPDERTQIEEASAVLRRARAGQGMRSLPLTVVRQNPEQHNE